MSLCTDTRSTVTDLLALAIHEQTRCETIACEVGSLDSELCDGCWFDAGALSVCRTILEAMQRSDNVLEEIAGRLLTIRDLNDERGEE